MFRIEANIRDLERILSDRAQKQLPFAAALALTETAKEAQAEEVREIDRIFDRPTRFTQKGVYVRPAKKSRLVSEVGLKPRQTEYLRLQAFGGTRLPKRRALTVPVNQRLNRHGNMTKGAVKRLLGKSNVFSCKVNGVPGIWERPRSRRAKKGPRLLVAYEDRANYAKIYDFRAPAARIGLRRFEANMAALGPSEPPAPHGYFAPRDFQHR